MDAGKLVDDFWEGVAAVMLAMLTGNGPVVMRMLTFGGAAWGWFTMDGGLFYPMVGCFLFFMWYEEPKGWRERERSNHE